MNTPEVPAFSRPPFWERHLARELQFLLDLAVMATAFALAYLLRFDFQIPQRELQNGLIQLPFVLLLEFTVVSLTGIYSFVWRYIGMAEISAFLRAALFSATPLLILRLALPLQFASWRIPLSVILLNTVLAFGGLLGVRVLRRAVYERHERARHRHSAAQESSQRVLLAGAGRAGVLAVREIHGRADLRMELLGFVDDDPLKRGTVIQGVKVLGTTRDLPQILAEYSVDQVVITMAVAAPTSIRQIISACETAGVATKIIPALHEILRGSVSISRFRDIQIEDILGREPVDLDEELIRRYLTGKSVLVTGAGGSIGSELARQIARFNPLRLVLVERAEGLLFEIDRELHGVWPQLDCQACVGDIGDRDRMEQIFEQLRPQVVFHAAAHKHVPLMESNPTEAVKNNVLATEVLARVAAEHDADAFVLISTDKAVRPASIMGRSKRVAELVIQDLDRQFEKTRFLTVRFGNVLGSTGSVVPIFREQIRRGGPVTVTHPEASRYFMTIPEAAQLVMEAGAIGSGGDILMLDMGEPITILDLANEMIRLSGLKPFEDIQIQFSGLRPGEKLIEELRLPEEAVEPTVHPKIFVGKLAARPGDTLGQHLREMEQAVVAGRDGEVRSLLSRLLPETDLPAHPSSRHDSVDGAPDTVN